MLKSLLPSRKLPDADFTMLTSPVDPTVNGKENYPAVGTNVSRLRGDKTKKSKGKGFAQEEPTEQAFDRLLDDLQIPSTLRPKLATMESSVKAAMLKSSHTLSRNTAPQNIPLPSSPHSLRKAHSSQSISSLSSPQKHFLDDTAPRSAGTDPRGRSFFVPAGHGRTSSLDTPRAPASASGQSDGHGKQATKEKEKNSVSVARYCTILTSTSTLQLDVETVKKLRLMLRNESASWTEEFVFKGGYSALLTRLNEILEVEWREEQHDDQVLHELLRCIKALSTSEIGCVALRSCCPAPFSQLVSLLYSDKKPGEVATRQLIVELLQILFDLYPPSSLPSIGSPFASSSLSTQMQSPAYSHSRARSAPWSPNPNPIGLNLPSAPSTLITLPVPHASVFSFTRALLLTPAPPSSEDPHIPLSPHAFIEELHIPRIYKTYLQELNDICRDYFWVFCHPNNTIWELDQTDEGKVEKPRAPGGMTGGVEFEAMSYMTTHFKLINFLAKSAQDFNMPKEHELSPHRLHSDLFLSGIDRIILVARKASTTYYPTLHLEIARYIAAATRAGYELPWSVTKHMGPPPGAMCKPGYGRGARTATPQAPSAYSSQAARTRSSQATHASNASSRTQVQPGPSQGAALRQAPGTPFNGTSPQLPVPRKVTPMFG